MTDALPPSLVFGVPISHVDNDSVVDRIVELATLGRQRGTTHQVATVNVDFLVNGLGDAAVLSILRRADMCLADGMPVVWAARAFGAPLPERVAGADLVPRLIEASARTGLRIHIFGSSADVAERSTALLHERYPGARFSIDPGPMIPDPTHVDDDVLASIAATGADVLLVALGNPKQERFITTHRERLGIPVSIGVGGSLDMLTGERRRAPQAVQRLGLEWVYRAAQEPQRLGRRYAHDIRVFVPHLLRELRSVRGRRDGADLAITVTGTEIRADLVPNGADGVHRHDDPAWGDAVSSITGGGDASLTITSGSLAPNDLAAARVAGLVVLARQHGVTVSSDGVDAWPHPLRPLGLDLGI